MLHKTINILAISALLCGASLTPFTSTQVKAQETYGQQASDIPLVVVRYNQKRVYYDRQLFNAASKAIEAKPSVVFSVVSFVPNAKRGNNERAEREASTQTARLVGKLREMGIPSNRINVSREMVSDARHHEIYIYVD